jgi:hypothetical protein
MHSERPNTITDGELLEDIGADVNVPWVYRWPNVSHYYGDIVRQLLVAAAILLVIGAPFYTNELSAQLPYIVFGTLVLVSVAAITSPTRAVFIGADAVTSGIGFVIFQMWALLGYPNDPAHQFLIRQLLALLFLFALYFSTKTLRNMLTNVIGRGQPLTVHKKHENLTPDLVIDDEQEEIEWKAEARTELNKHNDRMKREYDGE